MYVITIDETKCNACGECVTACPNELYKVDGTRATVSDSSDCSNCQSCTSSCEPQAITISET